MTLTTAIASRLVTDKLIDKHQDHTLNDLKDDSGNYNNVRSSDDVDVELNDENLNSFTISPSNPIKCSAVHSLERDMPKFDYSHLVTELRAKILEEYQLNPGHYSNVDIEKCRNDDWHLSRFLLRQKLDVKLAFDMLKRAMRYNNENLVNYIKPTEFPQEFYQIGGLFTYEPDRKGNGTLYIRVKIHRKIPEINLIFQTFLYYNIKHLDEKVNGKGIVIVLDCSGAGIASADMDVLLFLVSTLVNYFPKGLSYLLVHELPWILKPFWYIARSWVSDEHRQVVKFSNSQSIFEYIDRENLPDFMGGTCKRDYRKAPEGCVDIHGAAKLWGVDQGTIKKVLAKFSENLPPDVVERIKSKLDNDDVIEDNDNVSLQDSN